MTDRVISGSPLSMEVPNSEGKKAATFSNSYLIYAVVILSLVQAINYMDRFALSIVIEPVRLEFGLSDSEVGLLAGIVFAIPYMAMALPAAALTDRVSRRKLIACSIAFWSLMTGLCGYARNFATLLLARFGLGIGEASVLPVIHSMITDIVPAHRRAIAMSTVMMGATLGTMLGVGAGGWVSEHFGWRNVFLMAMVPGLVLAAVLFLTLRDAPRGLSDGLRETAEPVSTREALVVLWRRRTYRYVTLGMAFASVAQMGALTWMPAFLMRSYGMSAGEAGGWLSFGHGILSPIGIVSGGLLCDFLGKYDKRAMLWVTCGSFGLSMLFSFGLFGTTHHTFALVMLCLYSLVTGMGGGPYYAMQQASSGIRYRARGAAVGFIIYNFMGVAISPFIVGLLSDHLRDASAAQSLRLSLLAIQLFAIAGIGLMLLAARTMIQDLEDANKT